MNVIVWLTLVIFLYFVCFRMQNASRCHKHLLKNLEKESRWWVNDKLPLSPVLLFPSSVQFFISFFFPFFCTVSTDECLIVSLAPSHLACNVLSFLASLQGLKSGLVSIWYTSAIYSPLTWNLCSTYVHFSVLPLSNVSWWVLKLQEDHVQYLHGRYDGQSRHWSCWQAWEQVKEK